MKKEDFAKKNNLSRLMINLILKIIPFAISIKNTIERTN